VGACTEPIKQEAQMLRGWVDRTAYIYKPSFGF